jgi:DNA-binding NarL/FixJ family response regulator
LRLKILVVDDHEPFRRFVCAELQRRTEPQTIAQAADGLEAVQKVETLRPDLVVLDIGLPSIDGLEAARRMRRLSPGIRILFVSVDAVPGVILEALRLGARGYVLKPRASRDLLPAVEAVLRGDTFLSGGMTPPGLARDRQHEVVFYADDASLVESFGRFVATSLRAGQPAIALTTRSHSHALAKWLRTVGVDADAATRQGRYFVIDADEVLLQIMVNGVPDRTLFAQGLGNALDAAMTDARRAHPRVAICGECVGLLCAERNLDGAMELERTGNELLGTHDVNLLCAYPWRHCHADERTFERIRAEHTVARFR